MFSRTTIVYNDPNKLIDLPPFYYRCRSCDTNLTSNTPASQYQRLKLIQNTVRVPSSLYTMNVGSLSAYVKPVSKGVCWNQMSDRPVPSVQRASIPTGSNNSLNNKHHSVTSSRPGCQTPGGIGCDIKHNSYDRYLNRLKGKGPLRRGPIPPTFGAPIPFNPAFPIYGGKTIKTNIVTTCNCPIDNIQNNVNNIQIYNNPYYYDYPEVNIKFSVGNYVYTNESNKLNSSSVKATVIAVLENNNYLVQFEDGTQEEKNVNDLKIYTPCDCEEINTEIKIPSLIGDNIYCVLPSSDFISLSI